MGAGTLTDLTCLDGVSRRLYGNEGPDDISVLIFTPKGGAGFSFRPWTRALGFVIATLFYGYLTYLHTDTFSARQATSMAVDQARDTLTCLGHYSLSAVVSFGLMTIRFGAFSVDAFVNRKQPVRELTH